MSLVAYGSSDESDAEDSPKSLGAGGRSVGLFASLPAPKNPSAEGLRDAGANVPQPRDVPQISGATQLTAVPNPSQKSESKGNEDTLSLGFPPSRGTLSQESSTGLLLNLPKPKKRTEPVKISIPEIQRGDSDSDEDEPAKKKVLPQGSGGGLSSLLPQPRNLVLKETQRPLVPHTLTKRPQESRTPARSLGATPAPGASASPSAIKAAAKSAAMQLARQMAQEEDGSDEEVAPENYFSLQDSVEPPPATPVSDPEPSTASVLPPPPGMEAPFQSDAPLDFGSAPQGCTRPSSTWDGQEMDSYYPQYQDATGQIPAADAFSQEYYAGNYYQESESGVTGGEEAGSSSLFDDEAFRRLQGKRNRGKEEVKFLEIKGDDQLSGSQQWLTKNMTEEKEQRKSFSKKKGEQPTGQQRRKHQITYLIHQAKERELELKNSWADNKLTRRQTQAKYGF
ncbi:proline-rich protein PRCC [Brienomyrus brachyistius]|uniref:proline-rich protein PRCC n=1 Tax=Brienomyrus brachyistius TaxID=42636 RepID=UPI0020B3A115|nr:proline-rich protein PRCC [Brienomyrus brachyistius]